LSKLAKLIGKDVQRNPLKRMLLPDAHLGWIPGCLIKSARIVRRERPAAIYVSCSPFSVAMTGVLLKKLTGLPLVIDFRDPWSFNDHNLNNRIVRATIRRMESWCVKHSDAFIANTRSAADHYRELYPKYADRIFHIYNGVEVRSVLKHDRQPTFKMVYCGAFYNDDYLDMLFESARHALPEGGYEFVFTGNKNKRISDAAERCGISDHVTMTGFIRREEVDKHLSEASLLLFHNGFNRGGGLNQYVIKSKLYDYLAVGTPLLALAPEGEVAKLISRYSPNSRIVSSDYSSQLASQLAGVFADWQNASQDDWQSQNVAEFIEDFSPRRLTEKLVTVLNGVIPASPQARDVKLAGENKTKCPDQRPMTTSR
ncbi:MAG: glycosyltransferase, partial [Pirellulales bacterium]|nr:glycosyltransferase [Pirellulales bacterium]